MHGRDAGARNLDGSRLWGAGVLARTTPVYWNAFSMNEASSLFIFFKLSAGK